MRLVCVICTEIFVINSQISVVHCGHLFHEDCLSRWLSSGQKTCPQCRYNANSKTIVKKLYLTESDDNKISSRSPNDGPLSSTQLSCHNEELLNEIAIVKEELKEKHTQLQLKSNLIEQKDTKIKELETTYKNLKKTSNEQLSLIEFFKGQLQSYKSVKDDMEMKDKRIRELESKLNEYRVVDLIYQDHEGAFINEMKKYSIDSRPHYDSEFVQQLIRGNVLLKEHSDKLYEEKKQLRKKYFNIEKQLNIKEKNLIDKENEINKLREEVKYLENQVKSTNTPAAATTTNLHKDVLKRNFLSDSPLVIKNNSSIIDDSITINSPVNQNQSNNETALLLLSNQKKRKNPFARFDDLDGDQSDNDELTNKQVKLSDISKLCFDKKDKFIVIDDDKDLIDENKDVIKEDDVFIVKPIEHKKNFASKTKSASSLIDNSKKSNSVYSYIYDGFGGHKKLLNPATSTASSVNNKINLNKNLSKFKVTKSPFLK